MLDDVRQIARDAGVEIMRYFGRSLPVDYKADDSPLTQADLASNRLIQERLAAREPKIPIVSEESRAERYEVRKGWERLWLVDPLDGTKEFVKGSGEFAVMIALVEGGTPIAGVVHLPVLETTYYACRGEGAWRQVKGEEPERITTRRVDPQRVVVVTSRDHLSDRDKAVLARIPNAEPSGMGSALKFCRVAEGEADFYPRLGPTCEWDTGAAHAVLLGAGGQLNDAERKAPLRYNQSDSVLNPFFIAQGR